MAMELPPRCHSVLRNSILCFSLSGCTLQFRVLPFLVLSSYECKQQSPTNALFVYFLHISTPLHVSVHPDHPQGVTQ
jgi:hypothetical protein